MAFPQVGLDAVLRNFASVQSELARTRTAIQSLGDTSTSVEAQTRRLGTTMAILGASSLLLGGALASLAVPMVKDALESDRLANANRISAIIMGQTAAQADAEVKSLNAMYYTTRQAREVLTEFRIAQLKTADAIKLGQVALDLSVPAGEDAAKTLDNLARAVTNSSVVTLRQYGIAVQTDRLFASYAATLGKTAKTLTTVEQKQAVFNYILSVGSRLAGSYAAITGSTNDLLRQTTFLLEELSVGLGGYLLPTINSVLVAANQLIIWMSTLPAPVQKAIANFIGFGAVLFSALGALALFLPAIRVLIAALGSLPALLRAVGAALMGFGPWALVAIGAMALISTAIATNFGGMGDLAAKAVGDVQASLADAGRDMQIWGQALSTFIIYPWQDIFRRLGNLIRGETKELSDDSFGFDLTPAIELFFVGGMQIVAAFTAGIIEGLTACVAAVADMLASLASMMLGGSPPKAGPLKGIDMGGYNIIKAWVEGMISYPLDALEALIKKIRAQLEQAAWKIEDALFNIETKILALDKALYPLKDSLTLIEAAAKLVTIPLERQRRVLQRQLEDLKEARDLQVEEAEARIKILEKQRDALRELVDMDKERVEVIDHELFMETLRNKILGRAVSARKLVLESQRRLAQDQLDRDSLSVDAKEKELDAEKQRLALLKDLWEKQIAAAEKQLKVLERAIAFEEEKVQYAREELEMAEARQAKDRLALEQQKRGWLEQQRVIQHMLSLLSRASAMLSAMKEKTEGISEDLMKQWPKVAIPPLPKAPIKVPDLFKIKEALDKLVAAWKPVTDQVEKLREAWRNLEAQWGNVKIAAGLLWTAMIVEGNIVLLFFVRLKQGIGDAIDWIAQAMEDWHKAVITGKSGAIVDKFFADLWASISKPFEGLGASIGKAFSGVGTFINKNLIQPFTNAIKATWKIADAIGKAMLSIQTKIMAALGNAIKAVINFQVRVIRAVTDIVAGPQKLISKFIVDVLKAWGKFWLDLNVAVLKQRGEFLTSIGKAIDGLWEGLKKAFDNTGIPMVIKKAGELVRDLIEAIGDKIKALWTKLIAHGKQLVQGVIDGIEATIDAIVKMAKKVIDDTVGALWDKITALWTKIKNAGKKVVEGIRDGIEKAIDLATTAIKNVIKEVVEAIATKITSLWETIKKTAKRIVEGIRDGINAAVELGKTAIKWVIDEIVGHISTVVAQAWNTIKTYAGNILTAIAEAFSLEAQKVKDALIAAGAIIIAIIGAIDAKITEKWEELKTAAGGVIDGFIAGLDAVWWKVKKWIDDQIALIPGWIRDILGIKNSPSEKTKPLGEDLIAGIQVGMAQGLRDLQTFIVGGAGQSVSDSIGNMLAQMLHLMIQVYEKWWTEHRVMLDRNGTFLNEAGRGLAQSLWETLKATENFMENVSTTSAEGIGGLMANWTSMVSGMHSSTTTALMEILGAFKDFYTQLAKVSSRGFANMTKDLDQLLQLGSLVSSMSRGLGGSAARGLGLGSVAGYAAGAVPGRTTNYITQQGPTFQLSANYPTVRTAATIRDDLALMASVVHS